MIKYEVKVYDKGDKFWYLNGKRHREDGPAVEFADGSKWWYLKGELHRENGPAVEFADGSKWWYLNDEELTEEAYKKATTKATCAGKEVEIDGVTYVLKLKGQDNE